MKILLTGASGFLGSALARHWVARGHQVTALVRPISSLHRLGDVRAKVAEVVAETATEIGNAVAACEPDALVHTACAYGRAGETPLQLFQVNLAMGVSLLQAVLHQGRRTVFVNTGTVLQSDVSLYALGKNQFSAWGARLARQNPQLLQFIDVKLQHMFGPGDDASKFITHVLKACMRNEPQLRLTLGTQQRDFIYIADVVEAYDTLLRNADDMASVDTIDIGSGHGPTVRQVVEAIHRLTHSSTELAFGAVAYRAEEAMYCVADTARISALGWTPAYDLESGLQETIQREFGK